MREGQREPAERTGSWGLGFGISLAALALIAGWYVPDRRPAAAPTLIPPGVITPAAPTGTPWPATSTPSPEGPTIPLASPTTVPTTLPTATASPTPALLVYIVQTGDTLSAIAEKLGVSQQAIIDANNLAEPDHLADGQRLVIPKAADGR